MWEGGRSFWVKVVEHLTLCQIKGHLKVLKCIKQIPGKQEWVCAHICMLVSGWKEQACLWECKRVNEIVKVGHIHAPFFFFWSGSARISPMAHFRRWHIFRAGRIICHWQKSSTLRQDSHGIPNNVIVCLQKVSQKLEDSLQMQHLLSQHSRAQKGHRES